MLESCRLERQPNFTAALALIASHADIDTSVDVFVTGSVAELYIELIISCIGDVDIVITDIKTLAIPAGYPVPRTLDSANFDDIVTVCRLCDSNFAGYVFLPLMCQLLRNNDGVSCRVQWPSNGDNVTFYWVMETNAEIGQRHGPALLKSDFSSYFEDRKVEFEHVYNVRCLVCPPQATDWPTRHRSHGWPDAATIESIVGNGCDVVAVPHRRCVGCG